MAARDYLIERSADLKRQMVAFTKGPQYSSHVKRAMDERFGKLIVVDSEAEIVDFLDRFMLQHRLPDGHTVLEHFIEAHPELPEAERAMLMGWRDVVEGIFAVQRLEGPALVSLNLIDELTYRLRSNMGPGVFKSTPPGSFLVARLVPVDDEWLISGTIMPVADSARETIYRAAADLSLKNPRLVFRNPKKLERALEIQRAHRNQFIDFFGSDIVVIPGRELAERLRSFTRYQMYEVRDEEGRSAGDRGRHLYGGAEPRVPELQLPAKIYQAETVGVICDDREGINYFPNFGLAEEVFADPQLLRDPHHREAVLAYLESPKISPLPLRKLAERDPARASQILQTLLKQPDLSWERDGEALLRRYKADYFGRPPMPSVIPLSEDLARARAGTPSPPTAPRVGERPSRNAPCPCGSGLKYKRCCGR